MNIFVSYSHADQKIVEVIIQDLEVLGHRVSYDQQLVPGHDWWQGILQNIRQCQLFLFALTPDSLESNPCQQEYTYADQLNKHVLPVLLSDIDISSLPKALRTIQYVDYRKQDRKAALLLGRALSALPPERPLPSTLPKDPLAPSSPLDLIREKLRQPSLTLDVQNELLLELKSYFTNHKHNREAYDLLVRFHNREDVIKKIADQIHALLLVVSQVHEATNLADALDSSSVLSFNTPTYSQIINSTTHSLRTFSATGLQWKEGDQRIAIKAALKRGVKIDVAVCNPDNGDLLNYLKTRLGYRTEELASNTKNVLHEFQKSSIELRILDYSPGWELTLIDPDSPTGIIIVDLYGIFKGDDTANLPRLILRRDLHEEAFICWELAFQYIWETATPYLQTNQSA